MERGRQRSRFIVVIVSLGDKGRKNNVKKRKHADFSACFLFKYSFLGMPFSYLIPSFFAISLGSASLCTMMFIVL